MDRNEDNVGRKVLTRKAGQSIDVGNARIEVVRIRSTSVKIIVHAPKDVRVLRTEAKNDA